jgi:hypothetical protein
VFSLTLQASVMQFCKDSKVFKSQTQNNPITEEEEESHDSDEEVDEIIYLNYENYFLSSASFLYSFWTKSENNYLSFTKSIPIPPPKF